MVYYAVVYIAIHRKVFVSGYDFHYSMRSELDLVVVEVVVELVAVAMALVLPHDV